MALLDLQGMEQKPSGASRRNSGASKGCTIGGGRSGLSLLLC